jgi:FKBP-type peptidyl-prolyl cis-trans isomerase FkpA
MKRVFSSLLVISVMAAMVGCGNSGYKKTSTGMLYDIHSSGSGGDLLKSGDFIKVGLKVMTQDSNGKDSVLNFTDHLPAYGKVDTSMKNQHNFTDLFTSLKVGDSVNFVSFVDTMRRMGQQIPPSFKPGSTFKGWVKILAKFKNEDELKEDLKKEEKTEGDREIADIQKFLKDKNITANKTPNGVFAVVEKQGDGPAVEKGKMVKVMYRGTNFEGKIFDSNMDSAFGHKDPFSFTVGAQQVIPGWDEGLMAFKQGGKGKLYVPAMQAYKNQAQGPVLKPYTNLIFEVEVLEVKDAPPPAANPQMPMPQMQPQH